MTENKTNDKSNQRPAAPLLPTIDSPDDLRRLSVDELPQVCAEIRDFLIHSLSDNSHRRWERWR